MMAFEDRTPREMPTCRAQYAVVQPVVARLVGMAKLTTGAMTFSAKSLVADSDRH